MKSLVISLKTSTVRRKHIQKEFDKQNISFDFFDAITPDLAIQLAEEMQLNVDESFITKGELACLMSHVSIWTKIIDENIPYLAIFEDDIYLGEQADLILNKHDWISNEWNIIKLEVFSEKLFMEKDCNDIKNTFRSVRKLKNRNLGTAGYILSLKGAKEYLDYVNRNVLKPLDELIFDDFICDKRMDVYQICPGLCIQEMNLYSSKHHILKSNLLVERQTRVQIQKKRGLRKVRHEITRIYLQVLKKFLAINHGFK